jgi:hypothetical protein
MVVEPWRTASSSDRCASDSKARKESFLDGTSEPYWAAAVLGDVRRLCAAEPELVLAEARRSRREMGAAIDKARHDDATAGVDFFSAAGLREIIDSTAGTNFANEAVRNKDCAILDQAELSEVGAAAGTGRAAQRKRLARATNENYIGHQSCCFQTTPRWTAC